MLNATIIKRIDITDGLMIVRIKPDEGVTEFSSGQYVALGLFPDAPRMPGTVDPEDLKHDKIIRRSYSIASSPDEKDSYEFYIAILPEGILTSRLAMLKEGDRVHVAPKVVGKFNLDGIADDHNLIFVATGTGIAPFISMIRTASTWKTKRQIKLLHGVRYPNDLAYAEELKDLDVKSDNFKYYPIVSRERDAWTGARGYVQDYFKSGEIECNPASDHVYLCGNPAMVDDVENFLVAKGYIVDSKKTPGSLHLEKYW